MPVFSVNARRALLKSGAALAASTALPWALAQHGRTASPSAGRALTVAQIVDNAPEQQDVSRDFLVGARAAWAEINARGGIRGRPVQHLVSEVDGSPASLRAALAAARDNPACVALSGTAGDWAATQLVTLLRQERTGLAHAAPWLQNSSLPADANTFAIFAGRQAQIAHALKSLSVMGIQALGVVYPTVRAQEAFRPDVERIAAAQQLRIQALPPSNDLHRLGQQLGADSPAVLLFTGGTPELVQFTQGLEKHNRQRYVIALADVNLQTLQQMGTPRHTAVIATQAVPLVSASLPVVRAYRETLARLYDEPPTALSLAGYLAARYTAEVLGEVEGTPARASVLAAFQRRGASELGGFRIGTGMPPAPAYVTQSMLTPDGRVVG